MPQKINFKGQNFISLSLGLSFLLLLLSGIALYLRPEGSVASWNNWKFWGLSKAEWELLHTAAVLLFIFWSFLHLLVHIKTMISYFWKQKFFSIELLGAAILFGLTLLLINRGFFPFNELQKWRSEFKSGKLWNLNQPPIAGLVDLKLSQITLLLNLNWEEVTLKAQRLNLRDFHSEITLKEFARKNQKTPRWIFQLIFASF